jgi:hypothetical protein
VWSTPKSALIHEHPVIGISMAEEEAARMTRDKEKIIVACCMMTV